MPRSRTRRLNTAPAARGTHKSMPFAPAASANSAAKSAIKAASGIKLQRGSLARMCSDAPGFMVNIDRSRALSPVSQRRDIAARKRADNLNQTNVQPVFDIYASVQGRDLGSIARDIGKITAELARRRGIQRHTRPTLTWTRRGMGSR